MCVCVCDNKLLSFLKMRKFSANSCTENQNTNFMCKNYFFSENRALS